MLQQCMCMSCKLPILEVIYMSMEVECDHFYNINFETKETTIMILLERIVWMA